MSLRVRTVFKVVLPVAVLAAAGITAWALAGMQSAPEVRAVETPPPVVRLHTVHTADHQFIVTSQGTVRPRTESRVVPEVSGRVVWVSPDFVSGGFFEAGAPMFRVDSHDYEQAVVRSAAALAGAKLRLAQEQAEADIARAEWNALGEGDPPPLTARLPQLENAGAAVAAAEADAVRAQRDLARTEILAPYAGRVRDKAVDVGQFVNAGANLGTIYAIDAVEIRLPLPDSDLAYLSNLPLVYRGQQRGNGPSVVLRADFAGATHTWDGHLVRTEGEIDPASRMVHAVAQVRDPYGRGGSPGRPPLAVGMYVQAEIAGDRVEDVAVIPRSALRDGDTVWLVDSDARLRRRPVTVLRLSGEEVVIGAGLADGDRVVLSALNVITEGMHVTPDEVAR